MGNIVILYKYIDIYLINTTQPQRVFKSSSLGQTHIYTNTHWYMLIYEHRPRVKFDFYNQYIFINIVYFSIVYKQSLPFPYCSYLQQPADDVQSMSPYHSWINESLIKYAK